jgi:predicted DNA-binding ribbon-helix-helix protein
MPTPDAKTLSTRPPAPSPASKLPRSTLVSRNVTASGHRTSVRLEPAMWNGLTEICRRERATMHIVCSAIAQQKPDDTSLTAAIRVFIMSYYRAAATEEGHAKSGHGQGPANHAVLLLVQSVLDPNGVPPLPSPYMIGKAYPSPQNVETLPHNSASFRPPRR